MSLKKFQIQVLITAIVNFCSVYSSSDLIEGNELLATKIVDGRVAYNLSFNNPSNHDALVSELSQNFNYLYTKRLIAEHFSGDVINAMEEYASHPLICCIMANDKVLIIDILTGEKVEIRVGKHPNFATLVGSTLYVLNNSKNTSDSVGVYLPGNVSVIDIITKTKVCDDIIVGTNPEYAMIIGSDLYVLNLYTVSIIDTVTNKKRDVDLPHLSFDRAFRDQGLSVLGLERVVRYAG